VCVYVLSISVFVCAFRLSTFYLFVYMGLTAWIRRW